MNTSDQQDVQDVGSISPRLLRHLRYREGKLRQEFAQQIDQALREGEERLLARLGAAPGSSQAAPAGEELAAMRRDIKHLQQAVAETNRRLDRLATSVDMRFERVLGHIGDQARRAAEPTRARDAQGRLVDALLTAVETRQRLLGMTQRQVAEILQVHFRSLSKWLHHQHAVSCQETRDRMQQWLDATEGDAQAALDRLKDWM
jgi:hypothetical protein